MRRKIALVALGLGVAASFAPVSPASAVCVAAWEAVTGRCSPCSDANAAFRNVEDRTGVPMPTLICFA